MFAQKDWIVYDFQDGNVFCLSLLQYSSGNGNKRRQKPGRWFLVGFKNYFDLDLTQIEDLIRKEYQHIINSSSEADKIYTYVTSKHNFTPDDMNERYWTGLLKRKEIANIEMTHIKIPVNMKNLNRELKRLLVQSN